MSKRGSHSLTAVLLALIVATLVAWWRLWPAQPQRPLDVDHLLVGPAPSAEGAGRAASTAGDSRARSRGHPPRERRLRVGPRHPPGHKARFALALERGSTIAPEADREPDPEDDFEWPGEPPATSASDGEIRRALSAGEQAFNSGDLDGSYANLLWIIEDHRDHRLAPFALFKLAWIEYNLGDLEAAADDMAQVVQWLSTEGSDQPTPLKTAAKGALDQFDNELF